MDEGTLAHTSLHVGDILLDGIPLSYTGVESIAAGTPGAVWSLAHTSGTAPIALSDGGSDNLLVTRTGAAADVTFHATETMSLTVRSGPGEDTFDLRSLPAAWSGDLVLDGPAGVDVLRLWVDPGREHGDREP